MKNKKIIIFVVVLILIIIAGTLFIINKNNSSQNNETVESNKSGASNIEEVINDKEIIKAEIGTGETVYLLDAGGRVYACGLDVGDNFIQILEDVQDIVVTDYKLIFTLKNGETYLLSGSDGIPSDKSIKTQIGTAKRIMLDNIETVVNRRVANSQIQFLTKNGELYQLRIDISEGESNVEKINDNIKSISNNKLNISFIDNKNNGYVYGYNAGETGVLGQSDYGLGSAQKKYVTTPFKIGENIKKIKVASESGSLNMLEIYAINNNNELFIMGKGKTSQNSMSVLENNTNQLMKIDADVEDVYPMLDYALIKKKDNSLYTFYGVENAKNKKIMDNVKDVVQPVGYGGAFILNDKNELYAIGPNGNYQFGIGKDTKNAKEPLKVNDNVKKIFMGEEYSGARVLIVKNDGSLYAAGYNSYKSLGVGDIDEVSTWTKVEY